MSLFGKIASKGKLRRLSRDLASDPSARNYVALAREHVIAGNMTEVSSVCREGLELFPDDSELKRLAGRASKLELDARIRQLTAEHVNSPRPAVMRDLCAVLIEAGRLERAAEIAWEWENSGTGSWEPVYLLARVAQERFYTERRREDGENALECAAEAIMRAPSEMQPLELQLDLATRIGAWHEARRAIAQMLELNPGDPTLEARFRHVMTLVQTAKSLKECLRRVEHSGRWADEEAEAGIAPGPMAVRPMLQRLSADSSVKAAVYLRGATALVQGPKGPTADRTARIIRELVQASRTSARRMNLGNPTCLRLEGDFGSVSVAHGELGASAVWSEGSVDRQHETLLRELSQIGGLANSIGGGR